MAIEEGVRSRVPDHLIEGFKSVPPPTIGHARLRGFMDSGIKPLYRLGEVIVGRAVTAKLTPGDVTYTRPAVEACGPGDILVMDLSGERRVAAWGEMTSLAAQVRGAVGVIIDGVCTDLLEISEMKMPTWSRGTLGTGRPTPRTGRRRQHPDPVRRRPGPPRRPDRGRRQRDRRRSGRRRPRSCTRRPAGGRTARRTSGSGSSMAARWPT